MSAVVSLYGRVEQVFDRGAHAGLRLRNRDGVFEVRVDKRIAKECVRAGGYLHVGGRIRPAGRGRGDVAYVEAAVCNEGSVPDPTQHLNTILSISAGWGGQ